MEFITESFSFHTTSGVMTSMGCFLILSSLLILQREKLHAQIVSVGAALMAIGLAFRAAQASDPSLPTILAAAAQAFLCGSMMTKARYLSRMAHKS
jgi:hypothetical protein